MIMDNSKDEGLLAKYLRRRLYRRIAIAVLPTVAAILGAVFLFVAILSVVGGQSDSNNSDSADGDAYDSALILAAAKAMNADPTDEFVSNLEQVIMNESGGNASVTQNVQDVNSGGNEAVGLLQYTPGTFANYAIKGYENRQSAIDQLLAFFNNSDWKTSIGWTTILGVRKMEWLHSGPQGSRRYTKLPNKLDLSKVNSGSSAQTDIGKIAWSSTGNTYPAGQCTWWAKARSGWAHNYWGNGCQWGANAAADGYTVNRTPAKGALVSFAAGQMVGTWQADSQYGHVAYVEAYNKSKGTITISQGGTGFTQQPGPNLQTLNNVKSFVYIHNK
jgi:surface antigen